MSASSPGTSVHPSPAPFEPTVKRWSRSEYYEMAELGWFQGQRTELVGGEVMLLNPQKHHHAVAVDKVAEVLRETFAGNSWVRMQLPLACSGTSEPEPDVCVVPGTRADYSDHPSSALLIVEVSDTTLAFDRREKSSLYGQTGTAEYWLVNLEDCALEVHRQPVADPRAPFGFRYDRIETRSARETVTPLAKAGVEIAVARLLP